VRVSIKDKSRLTEIPKRERLLCRPVLEHVLAEKTTKNKEERNKAILTAHLEFCTIVLYF
jgi:hypothetical protein